MLYRLYIDEVGNHDLKSADNPNERFLSLTGVFLESSYISQILTKEMESLKHEFFTRDPDEPVIFHRKELINHKYPFDVLRNEDLRERFDTRLLAALERWEYKVITVVIDKMAHRERYMTWHYHPYHYCLAVLLERFILFLHYENAKGDVMVESRGGKEDMKLKESFHKLYESGTDNIDREKFVIRLTSKELKVKQKQANICGLQLADLIAYPSRKEILVENNFEQARPDRFGNRITSILLAKKYYRSTAGRIEGYGKKLLP